MAHTAQTWEYLVLSSDSDEGLAERLTAAGLEGWDLVNGSVLREGKTTVWSAFLRRASGAGSPGSTRPAAETSRPKAVGDTARPSAAASDTTKVAPDKKAPATEAPAAPPEKKPAPPAHDDTGFDVEDDDDESTFDLQP
jgi:hypothetical protein